MTRMWRGWEGNGTRSHQAAALSSHERVEKRKFRAVFNIIIKRMGMEGQLMETLKLFRDLYIMMRWTWMRWPSERRRRMVRGAEDGKKMGNHIFYDHELQIAFPFLLLSPLLLPTPRSSLATSSHSIFFDNSMKILSYVVVIISAPSFRSCRAHRQISFLLLRAQKRPNEGGQANLWQKLGIWISF